MNKKVILAMGLPMVLKSRTGQRATIELNGRGFVVCRYHPDNQVYLSDAKLNGWYLENPYKRLLYRLRMTLRNKSEILNLFLFKHFP
ncbi:hypothetical protein LVD17_02960 [Fulvivirga ulvae]|uniref:hypothetical protein n=1 Tax=Fulvivirga ulvae TaxID=2904245 RepID=UPI001F2314A6|nr:hypothetical protein [Fulvivirga ulvae]UII32792.1 hypothetical protein LVD17_02960 [Fulvivirga ulvae]